MFVFLIDSNPLLGPLLKLQAAKRAVRLYQMSNLAEAAFFIHDLRPDVVIVSSDFTGAELASFAQDCQRYPEISRLPLLMLGQPLEAVGAWRSQGHLPRPVNPEFFFEQVRQLLRVN